jgi:hypothetical protein
MKKSSPASVLRIPAALAVFTAAFAFMANPEARSTAAGTPGGTLAMFGDDPVAGWGRGVWSLGSDSCWRRIAEVGDSKTEVSALLYRKPDLLIGTKKDGLWFFNGKNTNYDREEDYLSISQGKTHINALALLDDGHILVGSIWNSKLAEGVLSGLWTWGFSSDPQVWRSNLEQGFPEYVDVTAIAIDAAASPAAAYVGTEKRGMYAMGPDGVWVRMAEGLRENKYNALNGSVIRRIAVSPSAADRAVYAVAAEGSAFSSGFFRIFPGREGAEWMQVISKDIGSEVNAWAVAADPDPKRPQGVWIGTGDGLFYSSSAGDAWIQVVLPRQPLAVQAILPFKDSLILLTAEGIMMTGTEASRTQHPYWTEYGAEMKETLCPAGAPSPVPTHSPTATFTLTETPTVGIPPAVRTDTPTPASPTPTPTPKPDIWEKIRDEFLSQLSTNLANIVCVVLPVLLAVFAIWLLTFRTGRSLIDIAEEVAADAMQDNPWKAIGRQIEAIRAGKAGPGKAGPAPGGAPRPPGDGGKPAAQTPSAEKTVVLILAADPLDAVPLRLQTEIRQIREKIRLSNLRDRFDVQDRLSVRWQDLVQALLDLKPKIVHFSGHGTGSGELCLEDAQGRSQPVPADAVTELFRQFDDAVDCVVLNSCYSKPQAEAIAGHIRYVIGMKKEIGDEAAIAFSEGFYQALGGGLTVEKAFTLGCNNIRGYDLPGHLTPVLLRKKGRRK